MFTISYYDYTAKSILSFDCVTYYENIENDTYILINGNNQIKILSIWDVESIEEK